MTWSLVRRFESSEHETYMIFLYDINFFLWSLNCTKCAQWKASIYIKICDQRIERKIKYLFNKSAKLYLPGCFSLRGPPLKRKRSCLIAVDQINAITSRMTDSESNAMKFNIKTERKYIPNFTGRFFFFTWTKAFSVLYLVGS